MRPAFGSALFGTNLTAFTDAASVGMRSGACSDFAPPVMKVHSAFHTMNICKLRPLLILVSSQDPSNVAHADMITDTEVPMESPNLLQTAALVQERS